MLDPLVNPELTWTSDSYTNMYECFFGDGILINKTKVINVTENKCEQREA